MGNAWQFFMGYRYAIFNYATQSLGALATLSAWRTASSSFVSRWP
jgi:hypothetical protein